MLTRGRTEGGFYGLCTCSKGFKQRENKGNVQPDEKTAYLLFSWNGLKRIGVAVESLDGKERLKLCHNMIRMDGNDPFRFDWKWLVPSGLSTKDFIAPSSFEFREGRTFKTGSKYGAVSFLQILAPELNDRVLADFLDMESNLLITMHIQSVDQTKAIKTIKRKITDLDKMKIEEQKKAVRSGYDMGATRSLITA